ncbi:MAG: hypothetical protein PHC75_01885 [Burkholderiales bacterium]|nr:hypothetical protein [Burkholderiales bacterium]
MKKILLVLLATSSLTAFATVGGTPNNNSVNLDTYTFTTHNSEYKFYTMVINQSPYEVNIYTKNTLHWDNNGWGDNQDGRMLVVKGYETKTYTGGNTEGSKHVWPDTPRIQHEWWFKKGGAKWEQTYSEQWLTHNQFDLQSTSVTRLVANNDWDKAKDVNPYVYIANGTIYPKDMTSLDYDPIINFARAHYKITDTEVDNLLNKNLISNKGDTKEATEHLRNNTVVIYTINPTMTEMNAECYSVPFSPEAHIHDPSWFRQSANLCSLMKPIKI